MNNLAKNKLLLVIIGLIVVAGVGYGVYRLTGSENDKPASGDSTQTEGATSSEPETVVQDATIEGQLVSSFPEDKVPLYPGDIIESSSSSDSFGQPQFNVEVKTADSYDAVDSWTRKAYAADGWEIRSDERGPIGGRMIIAHSSSHIATITYDEADAGVLINYGVSTK